MTRAESILTAQKALDSLSFIVAQLEDAIAGAGFFTPEATLGAAETQIRTLEEIQTSLGPRLLKRAREGETGKFGDLVELVKNATIASEEIAHTLKVELSIPKAISDVFRASLKDAKEGATTAIKATLPIGILVAVAAILYLVRK